MTRAAHTRPTHRWSWKDNFFWRKASNINYWESLWKCGMGIVKSQLSELRRHVCGLKETINLIFFLAACSAWAWTSAKESGREGFRAERHFVLCRELFPWIMLIWYHKNFHSSKIFSSESYAEYKWSHKQKNSEILAMLSRRMLTQL